MMNLPTLQPHEEYKKRFDRYSKDNADVNNKIRIVSNVRLILFITIVALAVIFYRSNDHFSLGIVMIVGIAVFAGAVIWHNELYRKRDILKQLIKINEMGMMRLKGEWGDFKDCGDDFVDHDHPYSWDLDVFGKHSIFQWINSCHTYHGRIDLARIMREPVRDAGIILEKQAAIQELAGKIDWRQQLELNGLITDAGKSPDNFLKWSEDKKQTLNNPLLIYCIRSLPYISLVAGLIGYLLTDTLVVFSIVYTFQLAIFGFFYNKTTKAIQSFEKNSALLLVYSRLLDIIEKQHFTSLYADKVKKNLHSSKRLSASTILNSISKILNATDIKSSIIYGIVNIVWLWDLQCVIKADRIKKQHGSNFRLWIETIGVFESLSSLSIIRFEHPNWADPTFKETVLGIKTERMGHPLLHDFTRVDNDFSLQPNGTAAIITGSNMSGKSTFLRSVGTNLVLAYAGAPVCAANFECSIMNIYSSMRVNDDLSTKVSTFYAELLRIKKIVEAVKNGETILFLLDELFRGTNSQDRHDGAVAVLHSLLNKKSIGIISTHDMDLCKVAEMNPKTFFNYHFEEQYRDDSISIDYKIKNGPSTTKNAMFLIRMMGIDVK
jgi:DNA mismatch repair ATPase MutS